MKLDSWLKAKRTIVIDSLNGEDSDISEEQPPNSVPMTNLPPIKTAFHPIKPIERKFLNSSTALFNQKIAQVLVSDDESELEYRKHNAVSDVKKETNPLKRRLIKASNKCKLQGKQFSSTQCSICLGNIENKNESQIGKLSCKHAFCIDCIEESSKFSNKCPYCRTKFFEIENGIRFVQVEQKNYEEEIDLNDEPCYVCGRNNDFDHLLQCQFCEVAFCHTYCDHRLSSSAPPEDSWYCLSCSQIMQ